MAYLDVIPLADAKLYLRIDDDMNEDDNQITRMINASLSYIERYTNVMLFARDKEYRLIDGFVRVYDYPINSVVTVDYERTDRSLYSNFILPSNVGFNISFLLGNNGNFCVEVR